jgi:hypothetical protein
MAQQQWRCISVIWQYSANLRHHNHGIGWRRLASAWRRRRGFGCISAEM